MELLLLLPLGAAQWGRSRRPAGTVTPGTARWPGGGKSPWQLRVSACRRASDSPAAPWPVPRRSPCSPCQLRAEFAAQCSVLLCSLAELLLSGKL